MKNILFILIISGLVLSFNSCKKKDKSTTPILTGDATFWEGPGTYFATVKIDTLTRYITGYYYGASTPDCGSMYCANFTLNAGKYSYTATALKGSWSGQLTITAGQCTLIKLQ